MESFEIRGDYRYLVSKLAWMRWRECVYLTGSFGILYVIRVLQL